MMGHLKHQLFHTQTQSTDMAKLNCQQNSNIETLFNYDIIRKQPTKEQLQDTIKLF